MVIIFRIEEDIFVKIFICDKLEGGIGGGESISYVIVLVFERDGDNGNYKSYGVGWFFFYLIYLRKNDKLKLINY